MDQNIKELLQEIHLLTAKKFKEILQKNVDEIPSSAYTCIVSFLKNNEITADVKDDTDLKDLKEMLINSSKAEDVVHVAQSVQDILSGGVIQ